VHSQNYVSPKTQKTNMYWTTNYVQSYHYNRNFYPDSKDEEYDCVMERILRSCAKVTKGISAGGWGQVAHGLRTVN